LSEFAVFLHVITTLLSKGGRERNKIWHKGYEDDVARTFIWLNVLCTIQRNSMHTCSI